MRTVAFFLVVAIPTCFASVDFTYSTLYDIYDFVGKEEVPIPRCDYGCLIFASTLGDGFKSTSGFDPYAENLIIHENNKGENYSVTDLSLLYEDKSFAKKPLTVWGPASISVLNLNSPDEKLYWQIVLYVVERTKASEFTYVVYDALNINGISVDPNTMVTVMSADPFSVSARENWAPNGIQARLTGFDNMFDANSDACPLVYDMPSSNHFPGCNLHVNGPIITLLPTERNGITIDAKRGLDNLPDLADNGFLTSAGYNGCRKPLSGGVQSFRSPIYKKDNTFLIASSKDKYHVSIDVDPNMDERHNVIVNDVTNGKPITITGNKLQSFVFDKTQYVEVAFNNLEGDQGFLMRYTTEDESITTSAPDTTSAPLTLTTSPTVTSTSTVQPTTSGSRAVLCSILGVFVAATMLM